MKKKPIEIAIEKAGGKTKLAKALNVSQATITHLINAESLAKSRVTTPAKWVEITGLTKKELFPEFQD